MATRSERVFRSAEQFTGDLVVAEFDPFDGELVARGVEAALGDRRNPRTRERPAANGIAVIQGRHHEGATGPARAIPAAERLHKPAVEDGIATVLDLLVERQERLVGIAFGCDILEHVAGHDRVDRLAIEGDREFIDLERIATSDIHRKSFAKRMVKRAHEWLPRQLDRAPIPPQLRRSIVSRRAICLEW